MPYCRNWNSMGQDGPDMGRQQARSERVSMGRDRPDMKFSVTRFEDREMLARTRCGVMLRTGRMVVEPRCGVVLGTGRVVVGERTSEPSLLRSRDGLVVKEKKAWLSVTFPLRGSDTTHVKHTVNCPDLSCIPNLGCLGDQPNGCNEGRHG